MSRPTVELTMIVRNGGPVLARCLRSVRDVVDSILVGDTGSTDQSREVAREFGARVLDVPWKEDFSQARNSVLKASKADWVRWLDADEMLDPRGAAMISELICREDVDAWEVWRWNYVCSLNSRSGGLLAEPNPGLLDEASEWPGYTRYLNTLLFRRLPGVYFENPVHETVALRVRKLGMRAAEAPFVIHHFGFVEGGEELRHAKNEHYHQLGLKKVESNPRDAWAHYELGLSELEHRKNPAAALRRFEWSIGLDPGNRNAWIYAGLCYSRLGNPEAAQRCLDRVAQDGFQSRMLAEVQGDLYFQKGDVEAAQRCFALAGNSPVMASKLGACEVRMGHVAAGLRRIEDAVKREPQAGELVEIQAAALFESGQKDLAAEVARRRLKLRDPQVSSFLVAAVLQAHLGRWSEAVEVLEAGLSRYPENPVLEREVLIAEEKAAAAATAPPQISDSPKPN